jgi:hypothetical protein
MAVMQVTSKVSGHHAFLFLLEMFTWVVMAICIVVRVVTILSLGGGDADGGAFHGVDARP